MRRGLGIVLIAAMAALAPAAGSAPAAPDPVPTTLYLHLDSFQEFPISTEAPPPEYASEGEMGLMTHTAACLAAGTPATFLATEYHEWRGRFLVGAVRYDEGEPFGSGYDTFPRLLPVRLDPEAPATVHWYLLADGAGGTPDIPAAVPRVHLDAEVRGFTGLAALAEGPFEAGTLVAGGAVGPARLAGPLTEGATHEDRGGVGLYGFEVPLDIAEPTLAVEGTYAMRVRAYVERDLCPADGTLMPNLVTPMTDAGHRPRIEWTALGSLRIDGFQTFANERGAWLFANLTDAWGTYDIAGLTWSVEGPHPVAEAPAQLLVPSVHCHCPDAPLQAIMAWPAGTLLPTEGATAVLRATTLQGHAVEARFPLAFASERESPAPALPLGAVALLALAALRRR